MIKNSALATRLSQIAEGATDKWRVNRWISNARRAHERHMRTSWPRYEKATKAFSRLQTAGMLKTAFGPYRQILTPEQQAEMFPYKRPWDSYAGYTPPQYIKKPDFVDASTPIAQQKQKHGIMYLSPDASRTTKRHEIVHYLRRDKFKNPPTFLNTLKEEAIAYWKAPPKATKLERGSEVLRGALESTLHVHYPKILNWLAK